MKIDRHIEIVSSSHKGLSSMGKHSRQALADVLSSHYAHVGITLVDRLADLQALTSRQPDLVFLGMKSIPLNPTLGWRDPQQIGIANYLEKQRIACTGSDYPAQLLESSKPAAKQAVLGAGFASALFVILRPGQQWIEADCPLNFPVFIKPADLGGGTGIGSTSFACNVTQLHAKIASLTSRFHSDILIEQYLPGREFSVAILREPGSERFSAMPIELVAKADSAGQRLLGGAAKAANSEQVLRVLDATLSEQLADLALGAFRALGARDYGRIDIRLDHFNVPQFLEANLIPSLIAGYGSFPKACTLNRNLDYESMVMQIVELGLERKLKATEPKTLPGVLSVPLPAPIKILPYS